MQGPLIPHFGVFTISQRFWNAACVVPRPRHLVEAVRPFSPDDSRSYDKTNDLSARGVRRLTCFPADCLAAGPRSGVATGVAGGGTSPGTEKDFRPRRFVGSNDKLYGACCSSDQADARGAVRWTPAKRP